MAEDTLFVICAEDIELVEAALRMSGAIWDRDRLVEYADTLHELAQQAAQ
jgi:hypothetical protein